MAIVKMEHMRQLKYCAKGVRKFFKGHNLDFRGFLTDGIDGEKLKATGDDMGIKVAELAESKGD